MGERENHRGDQCAIARPHENRLLFLCAIFKHNLLGHHYFAKQRTRFFAVEHRRAAFLHHMLRPAHRVRRVAHHSEKRHAAL